MRAFLGQPEPSDEPSGPAMHPIFIGRTTQLECPFAGCAEPFCDTFRRMIVGPNEAGSPRQGKVLEEPVASGTGSFSRETLSPEGLIDRIGYLRFRPVERLEDANTPDKCAIVEFFAGPHAIATQCPPSERCGHRPPDFGSGRYAAHDHVAHNFRVSLHRRIGIEITGLKRPEPQPIRIECRNLKYCHRRLRHVCELHHRHPEDQALS